MPIYDDSKASSRELSTEWLKMKVNPLYFITNYCYTDVAGGKVLLTLDNLLPKHKAFIKSTYRLHDIIFFASRRMGKTTLTSGYILWSNLFYPNFKTLIVIYDTTTGKEILDKIKFMYLNLPKWIKKIIPRKSKAERVSYIDFSNGSKIFYLSPSSQRPPETIGRGLNISGVYIDEAAFLPLDKIIGSLSPAYRSAKEQAKKNNYPYYFIITTTPNGRVSYPGKIFYELYTHAIPIEELYDLDNDTWKSSNPVEHKLKLLENNEFYNNYVKIKLHYTESKDTSWVEEEKRRIGYYTSLDGKRRWNQEYELLFLGSKDSVFPDDIIQEFESKKPAEIIELGPNIKLKLWIDNNELDTNNWYIFGIDTAKSIDGDYSAIEIFDLKNFEQIGELKHRFGNVSDFVRAIIKTIFYLIENHNLKQNFTLAIENVGIGNTTIEQILEFPDYDFSFHIYQTTLKTKKQPVYGIPTNASLKNEMIEILYQYITENPKRVKSHELIEELQIIERRNNKISAPPGYHDDLFMATTFAAYVRYQLLKNPQFISPEILMEINPEHYGRYKQLELLASSLLKLNILDSNERQDNNNNSTIPIYNDYKEAMNSLITELDNNDNELDNLLDFIKF